MAREIRIDIVGDSSRFTKATGDAEQSSTELKSTWERLQAGVDELGNSFDTMAAKMEGDADGVFDVDDAFGNLERTLIGVNDVLGVAAEQFGVNLGPFQDYSKAAADVAGGMEGIIAGGGALITQLKNVVPAIVPAVATTWTYVTALTAQAAAMIAANAPILLIIGAVALLAAGIVLLVKNWDTITEKVPILGTAVEAVKDTVIAAKDLIVGGLQAVPDWLKAHWPEVAVLISGPFAPIVLLATDAFGIRSKTIEALNGLISDVKGLYDSVISAGKGLGSSLIDGLKDGLSAATGFAGDVGQAVLSAVRAVVNNVIDDINSKLQFKIAIPGAPDINVNAPDIPRLALGGIVTRPTLAVIGEAGPEAVIPLNRANQALGGTEVHIHGDVYARDPGEQALATGDLNFLTALRARGMG